MATLYVENVPADLYAALRERARGRRTSISAEVLDLLHSNIPTAKELARRRAEFRRLLQIRSRPPLGRGPFPPAEDMVREDRAR